MMKYAAMANGTRIASRVSTTLLLNCRIHALLAITASVIWADQVLSDDPQNGQALAYANPFRTVGAVDSLKMVLSRVA